MKFSRVSLALIGLGAILTPFVALAAARITINDIAAIIRKNEKAVSYTINFQGNYDKVSGTLTAKGTSNGKHTLADGEGNADITANITLDNSHTADLQASIRVKNQMAYVNVSKLAATGDWAKLTEEAAPYLNQWIRFPLVESSAALLKNRKPVSGNVWSQLSRYLDITSHEENGTIRYEITLSPAKQRQFLTQLLRSSHSNVPEVNTALRQGFRSTKLTIDVILITLFDQTVQHLDATLGMQSSVNTKNFAVNFQQSADALPSFTPIQIPATSKTMDEIVKKSAVPSLGNARDAQRRSDVNTILNAIYQYAIDHNTLPFTLADGQDSEICLSHLACNGTSLDVLLQTYLVAIPRDPSQPPDAVTSGYILRKDVGGHIRISAPKAEQGSISVQR